MKAIMVPTLLLSFLIVFPAKADQHGRKAAELLAGACYHTIDDVNRVAHMAKSLKWKPAPKDIHEANRPVDGYGYKSWRAPDINGPVFISINKGKWPGGKVANVCSIVINISKNNLIDELRKELPLGNEHSQKQPFQVMSIYKAKSPFVSKLMIQIIHDGKGGAPINAVVVGIK